MVIVVNVLCDSLGILICFPNGSRKSAWGRVRANSSITKPRLSSSCCKFNLIYYLFIYLFSTCKVLKLPGFSGVMYPLWANYICNSSHQSPKGKNILSVPPLVLCKGMLNLHIVLFMQLHKYPKSWEKMGLEMEEHISCKCNLT